MFTLLLVSLFAATVDHPACDHAALARAESDVVLAHVVEREASTPAAARVAAQLAAAATEQLQAARALCADASAEAANPFADDDATSQEDSAEVDDADQALYDNVLDFAAPVQARW